jgi:hypothetical protein
VLAKELADLTEADIQALIDDRTPESMTLEFKRDLPGKDDKGRVELCKDVCALANSDGGDLVFGVAESDGCAGSIAPITGENADDATRRVKQVLDAGVEPRLARLPVKVVPVAGGYVLVMRVPASLDGPHWVRVTNESRRFVYRDGGRVADMNYSQVRGAFLGSDAISKQIRAFRERRVAEAQVGIPGPVSVPAGVVMLQLVPFQSLRGDLRPDLKHFYKHYVELSSESWRSYSRRMTVDALMVYEEPSRPGADAYIQMFRDGTLEAVFCASSEAMDPRSVSPAVGTKQVEAISMGMEIRELVRHLSRVARSFGATGRGALIGSILHTQEMRLSIGSGRRGSHIADRSPLLLPELMIDDMADDAQIERATRELLDLIWQSFGERECSLYRVDGTWGVT